MKGTFLLDIEIELAWGIIDQLFDRNRMTEFSKNIRKHLGGILSLLEKYRIPVTWGILGHVALDHCRRRTTPHPEMPRPIYKWLKRDWYEPDPCSTLEDEPSFYGKDIVDRVINFTLKSNVAHDIASHSFSHQLFGDPGCTEKVALAEIEQSLNIMSQNYGITPKVFIFPRDSVGHLDVLRRSGFTAFRGPIPHAMPYSEGDKGIVRMARKYASEFGYLASFYLRLPPPIVIVEDIDGLKNIPASMCFNKKPFIPLSLVTLKAKKGIKRAMEEKKIFHLYTHLINFGQAPNVQYFLKNFEEVLAYVNLQRAWKNLEVTTMRSLAEDNLN